MNSKRLFMYQNGKLRMKISILVNIVLQDNYMADVTVAGRKSHGTAALFL
jgi:hypothetical protein